MAQFSFADVKKPEHALKLFIRFALAKGAITYGMELMLALFNIGQGIITTIMNAAGFGTPQGVTLPSSMITTIEDCGFFESIPLWAVTLIDAYSGMCCGYNLSWEGGNYSLRGLMLDVIADKVAHCKKYGISIEKSDWNCDKLPATLVTDKGSEYI